MKEQDYFDALNIISEYHSTVISTNINKPKDGFVGDLGIRGVPAVDLSHVGFWIGIDADGLRVDK